jgi:uncharacterized membrane protein
VVQFPARVALWWLMYKATNMHLQGIKRKMVYVGLYETIAFVCGTLGFISASSADLGTAGTLSVFVSVYAVVWNFTYNALFERWEAGRTMHGRSALLRLTHAIGFELGFLVVLLPIVAWWLDISHARSFAINLGLNLFFFFYTMGFTWAFDRVFGLPQSARERD